jgi:glycosyltransferase involved in cell wall biosynthesis
MFDAIIVNGLWQYQGLSAFRAVAKSHVPYFVYAHGMLDPWSRRAHPFRYAKKFAYWLLFTRRFLRDAAAVIFTSDEEAQLAKGFFPGSDWNGYVVGNGIAEPPPFSGEAERDLMNRFPELHGRRVLLFLGRLHEKKGLDLLLRAFAATKPSERNLHLLICGSGEAAYEHALHSLAASLGLADRITWAGLTLGDAKWAALRLSELFVLASHQENFGIAIVEALAVGTPVLISDKVNIYRTIEQHGAGLVCDDNEKSLTAALSRWDSMSMEAKRTMRADARDCFHAYYSAKSAANKLRACIAGHVQERSKGRSKCA